MSSSKKMAFKRTLRQVFICREAQNPIPPPSLQSVYVYTVVYITVQHSYSHLERAESEKVRGATIHRAG